ncbi:hypothetical protein [Dyella sp. EPa41]|nr:hypothetical protein [Dyella sp. EPa41]
MELAKAMVALIVTPAQAGIRPPRGLMLRSRRWIPACAGMTGMKRHDA